MLPTTVLSGFLGAGKTTLLSRLLNAPHRLRVAVIVNDMSDVNIDAELIRGTNVSSSEPQIVEMHNGCICCTLREELLQEIEGLARCDKFDYLVIESSGISEPMPVAETFSFSLPEGGRLSDIARLDTLVTVVDGVNFLSNYQNESGGTVPRRDANDDRTLSDLLVEQVEFANVILVSKIDLIGASRFKELKAILEALNPSALVLPMVLGSVDVGAILGTRKFSMAQAQLAPGWLTAMRGDRVSESTEFGIETFVWKARRPLHPLRFWNFLHGSWGYGTVLRSKGFFWLASRRESIGLWHQAGSVARYEYGGRWWRFTPREDWPASSDAQKWIATKWLDGVGDCRQEIVFIGQGVARDRLCADLEACLLREGEMSVSAEHWGDWRDPFPSWSLEPEQNPRK